MDFTHQCMRTLMFLLLFIIIIEFRVMHFATRVCTLLPTK